MWKLPAHAETALPQRTVTGHNASASQGPATQLVLATDQQAAEAEAAVPAEAEVPAVAVVPAARPP